MTTTTYFERIRDDERRPTLHHMPTERTKSVGTRLYLDTAAARRGLSVPVVDEIAANFTRDRRRQNHHARLKNPVP
jgi:hypothetical protein